jgi:hypothetical protein
MAARAVSARQGGGLCRHLIVATGVSTDTNDMLLFPGMLDQTVATVVAHLDGAEIGIVLADAGYCTHEALTCPGPDRLIATGRNQASPPKPVRIPRSQQWRNGSPTTARTG